MPTTMQNDVRSVRNRIMKIFSRYDLEYFSGKDRPWLMRRGDLENVVMMNWPNEQIAEKIWAIFNSSDQYMSRKRILQLIPNRDIQALAQRRTGPPRHVLVEQLIKDWPKDRVKEVLEKVLEQAKEPELEETG